MNDEAILYYVHDPMCSWCWAFRPAWQQIVQHAPERISIRRLLGGLAPDSDAPMAPEMCAYLQQTWRTIQQRVPGTRFNFDFWRQCQPRRSTYPACRAVIAARDQGERHEERMIAAIQEAYYLRAQNPSDQRVLIGLAGETGLDRSAFEASLNAPGTDAVLRAEIALGRRIGAEGFPSLILQHDARYRRIDYDYNDPQRVLDQLAG